MRFDVNLAILFGQLPVPEQPRAAAAAGFNAVETWWPFSSPVPAAAEVDRLVQALGEAGVRLVSMNLSNGDESREQHGLVAIPDERALFHDHMEAAVEIAGRLGCRSINALYGNTPDEVSRQVLDDIAVENLAAMARQATRVGTRVVLEALNPIDFPRYGLHRTAESVALADRVRDETGEDVGILFDIYHVQRSEGDLIARIRSLAGRFGHVQIADAPGRGRPGSGEIAFERVLPELEAAGYRGFVGLEYRPSADPADTFAWLSPDRRRSFDLEG